jgi:hypothetical protein
VRAKKEIEEQAEAKRMAKKLEALGKQMQRGRMSKKEALLSMGQLRQELEKAADSNSKTAAASATWNKSSSNCKTNLCRA